MVIQIQIHGLEKVNRFIMNLPSNLSKEVMRKSDEFMRLVQRSAKIRAPFYTGFLRDQITIKKFKDKIVLDTGEAYYAYYQEFGFTPHMIPADYFRQHILYPNIPGTPVENVSLFRFVSKNKPFLYPALNASLLSLPGLMKNAIDNAINKSKKGG